MAENNPEAIVDEGKEGKGKGSKIFLLALLPIILLPLGGGAFLAYSYYEDIATISNAIRRDFGKEQPKEAGNQPIEYGEFTQLENLVVNPAASDGRFLMVSLGLEFNEPKVTEEIAARDVVIRDSILRLLSKRTVPELSDIALRDTIKDELRESLNGILEEGDINRLYFTQYVLQ